MDDQYQEDPYLALGIGRDATAAEIKSSYRKLALRCHPDKVTDEALKKQKADEFHKIQQAYEILNDEEKKSRHDAMLRLADLKAEMMRREGGNRGAASASAYDRPARPSYPQFNSGYEVRMPKFTEDYSTESRSSTRKHSDTSAYVRRSPHTPKEEEKRRSEKEDKARSERRRARDTDIRHERDRKYGSSSETVNDRDQFESERRKRDDRVKAKEKERREYEEYEELKRQHAARSFKAAFEKSNASKPQFDIPDYTKDYAKNLADARRYQESANSTARPRPTRTTSREYYDESPRRSRANETRRRSPEVVEPPSFNKSATTGHRHLRDMVNEAVQASRMPDRSFSNNVGADTQERSKPPALHRGVTMPNVSTSGDASRENSKSSRARPEIKRPDDSGYSSPSTTTPDQSYPSVPNSTMPPTPKVQTYRYTPAGATAGDYISASPDTYAGPTPVYTADLPTRTPKAEKERSRRSHEANVDLPRPPMGARADSYTREPREEALRRPSMPARESSRTVERERERERDRGERRRDRDSERRRDEKMYYGEVPSEYTKKNGVRSKTYGADEINVSRSYSREDVRVRDPYMTRSGRERYDEKDRDFARPGMGSRSNTVNVW